MIDKKKSAKEAVSGIQDGMTIMVGGFLGTGTPDILIEALVEKGVKHLTVIANDGGFPVGFETAPNGRGVGKLLEKGMVDHIIASHVGMNPVIGKGMMDGTLKCTLVPQGTLAEKIRAGGYGLGGVLTPTGISTPVETDEDEFGNKKPVIEVDGKKFLLERPLRADYALIRASICDEFGNYFCAKATKNFNYVMSGAADNVIVATEKLVKIGEVDPDTFAISGVVVDTIVEGEKAWQI